MTTVSIIVPVYNAESYLASCINSIIKQSYKDFELILINDGSTDNSGSICDQFASKDQRIKVIHQKNSGVSITRNLGIEIAMGKYIQFVDSDDTVNHRLTEKLVEELEKGNQLAFCGFNIFNKNLGDYQIKEVIPNLEGKLNSSDFLIKFMVFFEQGLLNAIWNKIYCSSLLKKSNIKFIDNLNMGEDLIFNLDYLERCESISVINQSLYDYLVLNNTKSLTGSFKKDFFDVQQMLFQKVREFLIKNNAYGGENKEQLEKLYTGSIVGCFSNLFRNNSDLKSNEIKKEINKIISSNTVRENINYYKLGNKQKQIIGYLIRINSINGIYYFMKIKNIVRENMKPLFRILKKTVNKN